MHASSCTPAPLIHPPTYSPNPQLAQASHYPTLNPDHLKAENRLPVILDKLAHEMQANNNNNNNNNTIICLQEV